MAESPDLTGNWIGHYVQDDRTRGLSAVLVQSGERLSGSMQDHETRIEASVSEIAERANLPPGGDEQIVAGLRRLFPDAPSASMRYVALLPPESTLEGRVEGREVDFLKTYRGAYVSGYRVGERSVGSQIPTHQVHYHGRLSPDGAEVEGRWWIDPLPGEPAMRRTEGTFVLRRGSAGVGPAATAAAEAPAPGASEPPAPAPRPWWRVLGRKRHDRPGE
jgi:hypothetical protein